MTLTADQACAIAAVRLMRDAGEDYIAGRMTTDLLMSELFCEEPIVETLRLMGDDSTGAADAGWLVSGMTA